MRIVSFGTWGLGLLVAATSVTAVACNKPDPNAIPSDAGYTETVTTASAGPTALPQGNAPGGDYDAATARVVTDGAPPVDLSSAATRAKAGADAAASPSFAQGCFSPPTPATAAVPSASTSAAAPAACGDKPLPPCPMYAWMKANAGPAAANADSDLPALAAVLDKIATFAPPGYPNWVSISKDGAAAARAGQLDAARASCRTCHTQYKAKYKAETRARPLP